MKFIADLHIHSRFSLATSKLLSVPHLCEWARLKGINVLGSGDLTHPAWREELRSALVFDEATGLYAPAPGVVPPGVAAPYFCLQGEISCVYKKGGKVRKVHNLIFMPTLEAADKFAKRLAVVGNIASDGRPILGLDSRDLLEILLECSPESVLIPAHIWTPWFAMFGSKSGFDSVEECFGDLTSHIFALETGLSSDPEMNRYLSALDGYALVSNSDAHSGPNLGREANVFSGRPSWTGMFSALRKSARRENAENDACRFLGTFEFYPEEGKYHLDGHRDCGAALSPRESAALGNICPVCGKPLTIGVLHRVMELADRDEPVALANEPEAKSLVPLAEIIAEIYGAGSGSRKVREKYLRAVERFGSEFDLLVNAPLDEIDRYWEPLSEAVKRLRDGDVILNPGYDGRFGSVKLFAEEESRQFSLGSRHGVGAAATPKYERQTFRAGRAAAERREEKKERVFSEEQLAAIAVGAEPALVVAGPGSGKTACLIERAARLLREGAEPGRILILTFTRRAAGELRARLKAATGGGETPVADTLHGLAFSLYRRENPERERAALDEEAARRAFCLANVGESPKKLRELWERVGRKRETLAPMTADEAKALERYREYKNSRPGIKYFDYTDLLEWLADNASSRRGRYAWLMADEAQDLSPLQLKAIAALLPPDGSGFFGIGDPDQSIYGFRGACADILAELTALWPNLRVLRLNRGYRSNQRILDLALEALGPGRRDRKLVSVGAPDGEARIFEAEDEFSEAEWIAEKIAALLGSSSHTLGDGADGVAVSPDEIAVLTRLKSQIEPIGRALDKRGVAWGAATEESFWRDERVAAFLDLARGADPRAAPEKILSDVSGFDEEFLRDSTAFAELRRLWRDAGDWNRFFEELAWRDEAERIAALAGVVKIITLHSSKGLEFASVFIPGLETGLFPLIREGADEVQEANLLYVGATRAARDIYLSYCRSRRDYGRIRPVSPSPWISVLKKHCRFSRAARRGERTLKSLSLFGGDAGGSEKK